MALAVAQARMSRMVRAFVSLVHVPRGGYSSRPMVRPRVALVLLLAAAGGPVVAAAACQGFPTVQPCGEIPGEGCMAAAGGTCADPTCSALYECTGGEWSLVQTCPAYEAGAPDASDGGACTPVKIDLSGLTTGCTPDLQNPPDCPIQAALGCEQSACLTECTDFFLCQSTSMGPEWVDVAYCACDGGFFVMPH
jgi:hypothetical protein